VAARQAYAPDKQINLKASQIVKVPISEQGQSLAEIHYTLPSPTDLIKELLRSKVSIFARKNPSQ
jgi:hypothetical protein